VGDALRLVTVLKFKVIIIQFTRASCYSLIIPPFLTVFSATNIQFLPPNLTNNIYALSFTLVNTCVMRPRHSWRTFFINKK
jgi:hypothetical protein